ncbi:hypothetical protein [Paludisphaera mucosa]|uniref:Uncharacterized protein n=1 Tax=Paludisphaera mucosa TaxID=3030827 RepID=A0ABT6FFA9_9BACT|nr:hypothetical protein [Paludisphaera mucosa]MDG3006070.1 hypothetical protein [Paludisphaera mucosa]
MDDQAVIVEFEYPEDSLDPLLELEDHLEAAIETAELGEFDGHELSVDLDQGVLDFYGPDAEAILTAVRPLLQAATCLRNVRVTLRYGPPEDGVAERVETLVD